MAKQRSSYQDRIIRNYYQNRDDIMLQRLGELVTDLFLAEGKAKARLWKRVAEILEKLKVPKSEIQHLVRSDNPTLRGKRPQESYWRSYDFRSQRRSGDHRAGARTEPPAAGGHRRRRLEHVRRVVRPDAHGLRAGGPRPLGRRDGVPPFLFRPGRNLPARTTPRSAVRTSACSATWRSSATCGWCSEWTTPASR